MRILFLTPRLPSPPAGGDKLLVYHHIRLMSPKVERIHLLSFVETKREESLAREFENEIPNLKVDTVFRPPWRSWMSCAAGLMSDTPLQVHYYRSGLYRRRLRQLVEKEPFDLCYMHLVRMAQYADVIGGMRRVLSMTDCLSLRYERSVPFVHGVAGLIDRLEQNRIGRYETAVTERMDVNIVVAEPDRRKLIEMGARGRVEVVANGVDLDYFVPLDDETYEPQTVSFLGNLHSLANRDAVRFLVERVWPQVRRQQPRARLQIIGINPPSYVRALDGKDGIVVTGEVDDVRPWLRRSAVTVCPVRIGAGVQNKILESLAAGVPVVTTPVGFEGLDIESGAGIIVADGGADEIARQTLRVITDRSVRRDLSKRGRAAVESRYSWKDAGNRLYRILEECWRGEDSSLVSSDSRVNTDPSLRSG